MATSIYKVNSSLPSTNKIEDINDMLLILEGMVDKASFNKNELDQIFNDIVLDRKFLRNQNIGHTLSTYTGWSHFYAESGYSIWKITPTTYKYNANNQLYFDNKLLTNKGNANSESATTFDKVWVFNGSSYINNTTEAGTEGGTEFSIFATTSGYLYIGLSSTFTGIKFEFQTRGSNYNLEVEYSDDSSGTGFGQLTANTNSLVDNTNNFESDGSITFATPSDWTSIAIDTVSKYWIRISSTSTPTTTAKSYLIIPNNSVIGLLAMSSEQLANEDWLWCTYSSSIYVTIRNSGNQAYEGNYYLTSHSSTTNKQNFFIYNHTFSADYQDSTFVQGSAGFGYMQPPVEDKDITDPASGLTDGIRYLIIDGGSGTEFAGKDNKIAEYDSASPGTWTFITPLEGMIVYVKDEDRYYQYEGNSWEQLAAGAGGGLDWQESVKDKDLITIPGSPVEQNRYIIATGATGAWSYFVNYITEYIDSGWVYIAPSEGMCTWVEDENKLYIYNGTSWVEFSINLDHGSLVGLADDDHTQYLLVNGNRLMSGNLNMGLNKMIQLADPSNSRDAATKSYVDSHINIEDLWDRASGGTTITPMNANDNLNMGSGNIQTTGNLTDGTNLLTIVNAKDAYNKRVDIWNLPLTFLSNVVTLNYNTEDFGLSGNNLFVRDVGIDHGSISGLLDDDHTQYLNNTRADVWIIQKSISILSDVDITSGLGIGELFRWDGSRWHNTSGIIINTLGNIGIGNTNPAVGLHLGTAASTHSLTDSNDMIISGKLEVDGVVFFDSTLNGLTLTSQSIGFTIVGGNTNKLLTLNEDIIASNLVDNASVPLLISSGNISLRYNTLNFELDSGQQLTIKESGIDHGSVTGLADNDHTQYVKAVGGLPLSIAGQSITFNFDNTDFQLNGNQLQISEGGINHSNLSNLSADAHTQYFNTARANTWFLTKDISSLNDVDIASGVSSGHLMRWNGSRWSNIAPNSAITRIVIVKVIADDTTLTTGDGKMYFTVPPELNSMNLVDADAHVYTVSSSGTPTIQIHNLTDINDMLATLITIDANEKDSSTALIPSIIDQAKDDVATADELRIDVDVAGTGTKGLEIRMTFQTP